MASTGHLALPAYPGDTLAPGIRSRVIGGVNGLAMHVLETQPAPGRPVLLLLHGFPELACSWRHVMLPLAAAGFHVVAPDRRGYGRTTGWDPAYDTDLAPFGAANQVRDLLALLEALDLRRVAAVVGHDFGAPLAAWCALLRPDVFESAVLMSAPFSGPPASRDDLPGDALDRQLAALPRPRKYYQRYYTTREANPDMQHAPQGLRAFLRAYFHMKSGDWTDNRPEPLKARTAAELARLPAYYVMDLEQGMAQSVLSGMPSREAVEACRWLTEADLDLYAAEYARTGFQGGLNEYRCSYDARETAGLRDHAGRTIDVPALFVGGRRDWGVYQTPGALEAMRDRACTRFAGIRLIEGAGHWVQQERPAQVTQALLQFLAAPHAPPG